MSGRPCGPRLFTTWEKDRAQMLEQGRRAGRVVVEGNLLLQECPVPRFLEIPRHAEDQPQRIVVEAVTHVRVAALGQGLVLVPGAAVLVLRGGHVEQALPHARGHLVDAAQEVLAGVPKPDAPPDAAFEIARAARHVARDHALVLVPDVHHPVQPLVTGGRGEPGEQVGPVVPQRGKLPVHLRVACRNARQGRGRGSC